MSTNGPHLPLALLALLAGFDPALPFTVDAPQDPAPVEEVEGDEQAEPQRLEAWPEPTRDQADQLKTDLARLRKASTPEMAEGGRDGLLALGDLCGPDLLKALAKEKDEDARARIVEVLDGVTGWAHTRLLAEAFTDRSEHVRLFALRRAAAFPDEAIRAAASAAFAEADARVDTKKEVKHERYYAALAWVSSGALEGLEALVPAARDDWGERQHELRAALEAVRGEAATARLAGLLDGGKRKDQVAALRLLAGCGDPATGKEAVRPYLDSSDNSIRVEAINALRGIVDGDLPIERLSVFEAVELAGEWKRRIA